MGSLAAHDAPVQCALLPRSPGLLSFPRAGVTLALDFPHRGEETLRLLARLNDAAYDRGGRLYPAKDATMTTAHFAAQYPHLPEFIRWKDPRLSSSFWRRVTGAA